MLHLTTRLERKIALMGAYRQLAKAESLLTELDYKRASYPPESPSYETATETMRRVLSRLNSISDSIGILEEMLGLTEHG
jgi:hypothetical protein